MTRVLIIHGFGGIPNGGWFPWLMEELAKEIIPAYSFMLPNAKHPVVTEWIEEIHKQIGEKTKNTIIVAHSLGVSGFLRYLERYPDKRFKGIVFVSGVIEPLDVENPDSVFRRIDSFVDPTIDIASLKHCADTFKVIHGKKDDKVPFAQGEHLAALLNTDIIAVENGDHFSQLNEPICYELPEARDAVLGMIG